jgi:hypothetical protein
MSPIVVPCFFANFYNSLKKVRIFLPIYRYLDIYNGSNMHKTHKLTTISVSYDNYIALKKLGSAGDSFNDVLGEMLKKIHGEGISK